MKSETLKNLLILGLTVLLCIAFDKESSAYGIVMDSADACSSSFFETISCNLNNDILVTNALYGYSYCDDPVEGEVKCCPDPVNDCFVSIPRYNFDYYQSLTYFCNDRARCRPYANSTDADVTCHAELRQQSDYVRLEYNCVPSSKTMMTATLCRNSTNVPFSTTLSCAENESIVFVGAILGFQDSAEESCSPGEDRCRVQTEKSHFDCIQTVCNGQQNCIVYAVDSAPASHTCNEFVYMYENITYYCDDKQPVSPVSRVEESCWSQSSTTTLASTESTGSSLTSTLTPNTVSTLAPNTASTLTPNTASTLTPNTASTLLPNTASTLTPNTASTLAPNTASTLAQNTSTLAQNTGMEVSLSTIIASTTAEPDAEDGDNTAAIIGVVVICALVMASVIAGLTTAIIMRKRRNSGKNRHDHLEPDSESPTPSFSGIDNDVGPQFNNPPPMHTQAGGHGVNQGASNGQVVGQSGVNSGVPHERMSLPNGRRNDRNDQNNGSNEDDEPDYV